MNLPELTLVVSAGFKQRGCFPRTGAAAEGKGFIPRPTRSGYCACGINILRLYSKWLAGRTTNFFAAVNQVKINNECRHRIEEHYRCSHLYTCMDIDQLPSALLSTQVRSS